MYIRTYCLLSCIHLYVYINGNDSNLSVLNQLLQYTYAIKLFKLDIYWLKQLKHNKFVRSFLSWQLDILGHLFQIQLIGQLFIYCNHCIMYIRTVNILQNCKVLTHQDLLILWILGSIRTCILLHGSWYMHVLYFYSLCSFIAFNNYAIPRVNLLNRWVCKSFALCTVVYLCKHFWWGMCGWEFYCCKITVVCCIT